MKDFLLCPFRKLYQLKSWLNLNKKKSKREPILIQMLHILSLKVLIKSICQLKMKKLNNLRETLRKKKEVLDLKKMEVYFIKKKRKN